MQKRYTILVTGRVQRVGFRGFARLVANRHGIFGYAENSRWPVKLTEGRKKKGPVL